MRHRTDADDPRTRALLRGHGLGEVQRVAGLLYGGGLGQLWKQLIAAAAIFTFSFIVSGALALLLKATMGLRISPEDEELGIDAMLHRDPAYELT